MTGRFRFAEGNDDDADSGQYKFGSKLDFDVSSNDNLYPLISYNYLDVGKTTYHFTQDCFDLKDVENYFNQLRKFSNTPLRNLIDNSGKDDHFRIDTNPRGKLRKLLEDLSGIRFNDATVPIVGHFALYTNSNASRATTVKSPRVFFMLGKRATMHILFYDPYHEIHAKK